MSIANKIFGVLARSVSSIPAATRATLHRRGGISSAQCAGVSTAPLNAAERAELRMTFVKRGQIDTTGAPKFRYPLERPVTRQSAESNSVPSDFIVKLCERVKPHDLVTEKELDALAKLNGQYSHLEKYLLDHVDSKVSATFYASLEQVKGQVATGEISAANGVPLKTKDQIREEFYLRRRIASEKLRALNAEYKPIAEAVAERIAAVARSVALDEEEAEFQRARRWGYPFVHSPILHKLDLIARRPEVLLSGSFHPKTCLVYAGIRKMVGVEIPVPATVSAINTPLPPAELPALDLTIESDVKLARVRIALSRASLTDLRRLAAELAAAGKMINPERTVTKSQIIKAILASGYSGPGEPPAPAASPKEGKSTKLEKPSVPKPVSGLRIQLEAANNQEVRRIVAELVAAGKLGEMRPPVSRSKMISAICAVGYDGPPPRPRRNVGLQPHSHSPAVKAAAEAEAAEAEAEAAE